PLQFFDPALNLFGLSRLVAKAIDEYFQLLDALPLVAIRGLGLLAPLCLLLFVFIVIAGVEVNALVPDFDNLVDGDVEEVAVVRDQHKREWIFAEILLQPIAGFEIKMIRRLIEQQQVWLLQKQLGQRDAHLPTAGEFVSLPLPIFFTKPQTRENAPDLRLNGITVAGAEFVLHALIAIGNLCVLRRRMVKLRHAGRKLLHFFFHSTQLGKNRHALGEHGATGKRKTILREISSTNAFGDADRAVVDAF